MIGQTSQRMHSGQEHHESQGDHAHELAEARRCAVDEAHDLAIECQACGGCKGCVGVPRGSLAVRISDCQPDRAIVVASGGVLRYTHIHTHLSMTPQDHLMTAPTPQSTIHKSWRSGNLHHPGWRATRVPVNTHSTPVLPKWEEAVGSSQSTTPT